MASPTTAVNFLEVVRKSGLLNPEQLDDLFGTSVPSDPNQCAASLVKAELLTAYQAKQLLAGKFRGFFLGPYKILKPIGQGGMGAVYLAEHTTLGRKVAIKVLTAEKAKDKLTLERFNREARAAAALDHPNIVRLHDISQGAGVHFLVMEYVDGNDLQSLMAQTGPLHYAQAAQYVAQAAAGLQHAHAKGFIHRDIKPANLILTKDGGVKILDMGLARSFTDAKDNLTALLADGDIAGTVDFLSPEQAMNHPLDERSDLYSLGATFYALVTGHPPFNGSTAQKLMQHQLKEPPSVTKKLSGRVPQALSDVVAKMMAKRPSERHQTAGDVIDALGPWLPAVSTGNIVQDPLTLSEFRMPTSAGTRTPPPKGKLTKIGLKPVWQRPPVLVGAGVGLLLLVGGVVLALTLGGAKSPDTGVRLTQVPTYGPPQQPQTSQSTAPPAGNPAPGRAAIPPVRIDFAGLKPATLRVSGSAKSEQYRAIGGEPLPSAVHVNHYNGSAEGEYTIAEVGGATAVGLRQLNGQNGVQVHFFTDNALGRLPEGARATVRLTYLFDGTGSGSAACELNAQPYTKHATTPLPPTNGRWRSVDLAFVRPPDGSRYDLIVNPGNAPYAEGTLYVRSVELLPPVADEFDAAKAGAFRRPTAPPVGRSVRAFDLSSVTPFKKKFQDGMGDDGATAIGFTDAVYGTCWKKESVAEFRCEAVDGPPAIGVTNLNDVLSSQIGVGLKAAELRGGKRYVARVEYQTRNDAAGDLVVQTQGDYRRIGTSKMAGTNGKWATADVAFDAPADIELTALVENTAVGEGNTLLVRRLEVFEAK